MSATVPSKNRTKARYIAPSLTVYGSATKLTAGGTGNSNEGAGTDPAKRP